MVLLSSYLSDKLPLLRTRKLDPQTNTVGHGWRVYEVFEITPADFRWIAKLLLERAMISGK